ncbi:hypothetical protein SM12BL1_02590 [Serratia marcescens]|nr:Uncharacterised protein [Serratia marcescens]CVE65392.1 Uncharacterised protein [Serratia marcescens]CVF52648.1 Uncharacterised protein [Serratia marcescens]CVF76592.1 Uncharacterised protein [Serratia marcescens]CVG00682.1 Uncharacterised protein [Serratia marcescens]
MTNLSELSKPVMYVVRTLDGSVASVKSHSYTAPKGFTSEPLYSQEYVSALTQRIAELEAIRAAAEKLVRCKGRYHSEQNYLALAALFGVTTPDLQPADGDSEAVIAELRAKLATPVRLSQRYETAGYCIDEHYCQEAADGDYLDRDELIASLHEQGFTVEGEDA